MTGPYVAIAEQDGYRQYFGPFSTSQKAVDFLEEFYADRDMGLIEKLNLPVRERAVHPNQTTIADHISEIHDHVG